MRGQGAGRQGESGADSHHFGMQGKRPVCAMAAAHGFKRREGACVLLIVRLRLTLWLWLRLQTLLELGNSRAVQGGGWQNARLKGTAIKAWTVAVEALADNLTTSNDDRTMAIVKWRKLGLGEALGEIHVVAWRHFDCDCW